MTYPVLPRTLLPPTDASSRNRPTQYFPSALPRAGGQMNSAAASEIFSNNRNLRLALCVHRRFSIFGQFRVPTCWYLVIPCSFQNDFRPTGFDVGYCQNLNARSVAKHAKRTCSKNLLKNYEHSS